MFFRQGCEISGMIRTNILTGLGWVLLYYCDVIIIVKLRQGSGKDGQGWARVGP